jgi:hypothetical protein
MVTFTHLSLGISKGGIMLKQSEERKNTTVKYCSVHKMHFNTCCVYCDEQQTKLEQAVKDIEAYRRSCGEVMEK